MFFWPAFVIPIAVAITITVFILTGIQAARKHVGEDAKDLYKSTSEIASEIRKTIKNSTHNNEGGKLKKCSYCGGSYEGNKCPHCGAGNVK